MSTREEIQQQLDDAVHDGDWGAGVSALARLTLSTGERAELVQSTKVLDLDEDSVDFDMEIDVSKVLFTQDDMELNTGIELSWQDWTALGRPKQITVTVVAGDELNPAALGGRT